MTYQQISHDSLVNGMMLSRFQKCEWKFNKICPCCSSTCTRICFIMFFLSPNDAWIPSGCIWLRIPWRSKFHSVRSCDECRHARGKTNGKRQLTDARESKFDDRNIGIPQRHGSGQNSLELALKNCFLNTAIAWMPLNDWVHNFPSAPSRNRGRPPKRWDQALTSFSSTYFGEQNWLKAAQSYNQWSAAESAFVKYCESLWRTIRSPCPFRIEVTRTGERKKERFPVGRLKIGRLMFWTKSCGWNRYQFYEISQEHFFHLNPTDSKTGNIASNKNHTEFQFERDFAFCHSGMFERKGFVESHKSFVSSRSRSNDWQVNYRKHFLGPLWFDHCNSTHTIGHSLKHAGVKYVSVGSIFVARAAAPAVVLKNFAPQKRRNTEKYITNKPSPTNCQSHMYWSK